jgi:hypothetical protein
MLRAWRPIARGPVVAILVGCACACAGAPQDNDDAGIDRARPAVRDATTVDAARADVVSDIVRHTDAANRCGSQTCAAGLTCCEYLGICYDPTDPDADVCQTIEGGPGMVMCGSTVCRLGLACCATTLRCYDPFAPWLCLPADAPVPCGGPCPGGWACCASTNRCYDDRFPEQCTRPTDAGMVCGITRCRTDQLCCALTMRCYDRTCTDCCTP